MQNIQKVQAQELAKQIGATITARGRRIAVVFSKPCIRYDNEGKEYFYIEPNTEYVRGSYSEVAGLLSDWKTEAQQKPCCVERGETEKRVLTQSRGRGIWSCWDCDNRAMQEEDNRAIACGNHGSCFE